MNRSLLFLCAALLLFHQVFACLNGETTMLKDGTIIYFDDIGEIVPHGHIFHLEDFKPKLRELDSLWRVTKDLDYLSDYGLVLTLNNQYQKARDVYQQIEQMRPGRYSTASNLGTVYELLGENDKALKWIKKAVEIDPTSHESSEWIHVKILEAKINKDKPLTSYALINTDFGEAAMPKSNLPSEKLLQLRSALYYQLNERISFINEKDSIVSLLLFDLGNIAFLTGAKEESVVIYKQAKAYGFSQPILKLRVENATAKPAFTKQVTTVKVENKPANKKLVWFLGSAAVILITILGIKKIRDRQHAE